MSGTIVLQLNGSVGLTATASGSYTFATTQGLTSGVGYAVTVSSAPTGQVCSVANGSGTITGNVSNVTVTCASTSVGVSVSGLTGSGLVVQLGGSSASNLSISANGTYAFTANLPSSGTGAAPYVVQIVTQPSGQTCTLTKAAGLVNVTYPSNANGRTAVVCTANDMTTGALSGTYQLTVTGFTGRALITFYSDGTYIFVTHSDDAACTANNGNGLEYGVYHWNQNTHAFAFVNAAVDTNGDCGVSSGSALLTGTVTKNGDGTLSADLLDTDGSNTHIYPTLTPVTSTSGSLIGSWSGNAALRHGFIAYFSNGTFMAANSQGQMLNGVAVANTAAGIEDGCYALSGSTASGSFTINLTSTCAVSGTQTGVDANGSALGFSALGSTALNFSVSTDTMLTWVLVAVQSSFTRNVTN